MDSHTHSIQKKIGDFCLCNTIVQSQHKVTSSAREVVNFLFPSELETPKASLAVRLQNEL
jgi:hypothetical protein